jgi:L-cysteine:1D-myo-inositol 2-amino-2-deoxy-alpha-D-glucopyranoside ligase
MHTALISKDGHKMSKSLGNLVFVDALRETWDPMVIRLLLIENHYRTEWEWDDSRLEANHTRLIAWRKASQGTEGRVIDQVRDCLDADLRTPEAVAAIDAAASRGESTAAAAALLGVVL